MSTLWGMGIAVGADLRHFMQALRSLTSLVYVTKRVLQHGWDLATERRSMQLVAGNALAASRPPLSRREHPPPTPPTHDTGH